MSEAIRQATPIREIEQHLVEELEQVEQHQFSKTSPDPLSMDPFDLKKEKKEQLKPVETLLDSSNKQLEIEDVNTPFFEQKS